MTGNSNFECQKSYELIIIIRASLDHGENLNFVIPMKVVDNIPNQLEAFAFYSCTSPPGNGENCKFNILVKVIDEIQI